MSDDKGRLRPFLDNKMNTAVIHGDCRLNNSARGRLLGQAALLHRHRTHMASELQNLVDGASRHGREEQLKVHGSRLVDTNLTGYHARAIPMDLTTVSDRCSRHSRLCKVISLVQCRFTWKLVRWIAASGNLATSLVLAPMQVLRERRDDPTE